jgi:tellurite resistance protein TerC
MNVSAIALPTLAELVAALPVIVSLILIEGLLSVDNALAIAAMARHLPKPQQEIALRLGIFGAYFFRGICMGLAAWIIENPWLKIGGAVYLIYLMCKHFAACNSEEEAGANPSVGDVAARGLVATIVAIEVMDLSLSVDNVVAAVAMSPELWVVCSGVFIGILALRFVAGACIKLIERFPILEHVAFLLIGYVGFILCFELLGDPKSGMQILPGPVHVSALEKFIGIAIILSLSVVYAENVRLQRVFRPVLAGARLPMRAVSYGVGLVLQGLLWPFMSFLRLFRGRQAKAPKPSSPI